MIALSENGAIPDPAKLVADGAQWSWFCTWIGEKLKKHNAEAFIKTTFNHERVLTLGQFNV
jgi:mannan endo-1,4-beta-mannosidase